jgi:hypothetical protein
MLSTARFPGSGMFARDTAPAVSCLSWRSRATSARSSPATHLSYGLSMVCAWSWAGLRGLSRVPPDSPKAIRMVMGRKYGLSLIPHTPSPAAPRRQPGPAAAGRRRAPHLARVRTSRAWDATHASGPSACATPPRWPKSPMSTERTAPCKLLQPRRPLTPTPTAGRPAGAARCAEPPCGQVGPGTQASGLPRTGDTCRA